MIQIETETKAISIIAFEELNCRDLSSSVPLNPLDIMELYTLSPLSYPLINNAPEANASGFSVRIPFSA